MKPLVVFLTMFISLTDCISSGSIVEDQKKHQTTSPIGHWTLVDFKIIEDKQSVEKYNQAIYEPDDRYIPVYMDENGVIKPYNKNYSKPVKDLVFKGDRIVWMDYPLQIRDVRIYTIQSDTLKINYISKSIALSFDQDTLRISYLDEYGLFLEETYKRTRFNDSILNILFLYKTNFPELAGTWELMRMFIYDDGHEHREHALEYPYKIPDTLVLTKEELASTLFLDRSCQILTDGEKRKYFMEYSDGGELLLTPDTWYNPYEWLNKGIYVNQYLRFVKVK